jgi:hypothetical protein
VVLPERADGDLVGTTRKERTLGVIVLTLGGQDMKTRPNTGSARVPAEAEYLRDTDTDQRKIACRLWAEELLRGLENGSYRREEVAEAICFPMVQAIVNHLGDGDHRIYAFGTDQGDNVKEEYRLFDTHPVAALLAEVSEQVLGPRCRVIARQITCDPTDEDALLSFYGQFFHDEANNLGEEIYVSHRGGTPAMTIMLAFAAQRWAGQRIVDGKAARLHLLKPTRDTSGSDPCRATRVTESPLQPILEEFLVKARARHAIEEALSQRAYRTVAMVSEMWAGFSRDLKTVATAARIASALLDSDFKGAAEVAEGSEVQKVLPDLSERLEKLQGEKATPKVLLQAHAAADRLQAGHNAEFLARAHTVAETLAGALFESCMRSPCTGQEVWAHAKKLGLEEVWPKEDDRGPCTLSGDKRHWLREAKGNDRRAGPEGCNGLLPCWAGGWQPTWTLRKRAGRNSVLEVSANRCDSCPVNSDADTDRARRAMVAMLLRGSPLMKLRHDSVVGHAYAPTTRAQLRERLRRTSQAQMAKDFPHPDALEKVKTDARNNWKDPAAWLVSLVKEVLPDAEDIDQWNLFESLKDHAHEALAGALPLDRSP